MLTEGEFYRLPPIFQSTYEGDIEAVNHYIAADEDLSTKTTIDLQSMRAIDFAAWCGELEIVKRFIEAGCDPQEGNNCAILMAAKNGHLEVVNYLLEMGCNPQTVNNLAIRWAAINGHLGVFDRLLAEGCDPQTEHNLAIRGAARNCHNKIVFAIFDAGLKSGQPIDRDIAPEVAKMLDRRDVLPMIFSTLTNEYEHGHAFLKNLDKVFEYEGSLSDKNSRYLIERSEEIFQKKYNQP